MRHGKFVLIHIFFFYVRRALLAVCVVYINQNLAIQIAVLLSTTLFQVILISGFKVYREKSRNRSEVMNEYIALLIMYGVFIFTDFIPPHQLKVKFVLGHLFSAFILSHLLVNVTLISARNIHLSTRKYWAKKQLKITKEKRK